MWCMDGVYIIDKLILCVEYLNTSCIISLCRKSKRLCYSHVCVLIKCTSLVCFLHIYWQKYLKALCHSFASWKKNHSNWNLHLCCVHYYLFCARVIGEFNLLYVWMTTGDIDCPWNCVLSVNTAPFHPFQKANSLFLKLNWHCLLLHLTTLFVQWKTSRNCTKKWKKKAVINMLAVFSVLP